MREKCFDLAVIGAAGSFYLVNRLWLTQVIGGLAGWFLSCYANDIFAGAALAAWADLLLRWGRLPPFGSRGRCLTPGTFWLIRPVLCSGWRASTQNKGRSCGSAPDCRYVVQETTRRAPT